MTGGGFDLHTHSLASDGVLLPAELVKLATASTSGIALTDHDTVAGLDEAAAEAGRRGFPFIPGVELTTDYGPYEVHVLGYFIDRRHPSLIERLDMVARDRSRRAQEIVARLAGLGFPVAWEEVLAQTHGSAVGRPHILNALIAAGLVARDRSEAFFSAFLAKGAPAFVPHRELPTEEAVGLAAAAGGVPVLAHPGRICADGLLPRLVEMGIRGLEIHYPAHSPAETFEYARLAAHYGLIPTGGSDFHGKPGGPTLGLAVAGWQSVHDLAKCAGAVGEVFLATLNITEEGVK